MNKINKIFIHHSASEWGTANIIRQWHLDKGWRNCGYHFIILNGILTYDDYKNNRIFDSMIGQIEVGRPINADPWLDANEQGAHAYGYNDDSIGICLIHDEKPYKPEMINSLHKIVLDLMNKFDINVENVLGHYEVETGKPHCPSIDMNKFRFGLKMLIDAKRVSNKLKDNKIE